jgi:hypothetical protein
MVSIPQSSLELGTNKREQMTAIEAAPFTRKFLQKFVQSSADKNLF